MTFTDDNFFKIYYMTIKKFPVLEALPWTNWSLPLFLNIPYATTISSGTADEAHSCKSPDSEQLSMTSRHQMSLPRGYQAGFAPVLMLGKDSVKALIFWEGADQTLFVLHHCILLGFFSYPAMYIAVQNTTGEGWNWEGTQNILKLNTLLFIADLVI